MAGSRSFTSCIFAVLLATEGSGSPIKHVVVMMMENHSFDNMLGWLPGIGDVTGKEYNLANASDPSSQKYYITKGASYCTIPDPDHSFPGTGLQMYAPHAAPVNSNGAAITMGGFAQSYKGIKGNPQEVMGAYTPDQVPVISTLYSEFVGCTNYFASMPGPTGPNRMFMHTGTTLGYTGANYYDYPLKARSIFEDLMEANLTWAIHFHDFTTAHGIEPLNSYKSNFVQDPGFSKFFAGLNSSTPTLANYTFLVPLLSPNFGMQPTSQHPDYDIRAGEEQMRQVYQALRASEFWMDTLFVINYDEHGGFYDKQHPPTGVPNPCPACNSQPYPFDWQRLGVRIPTVFASPWLPKTVDDTVYDHTSVLATVRRIFNLTSPPLTPREAAANTFFDKFLTEPRTDTPLTLPPPPVDPPHCNPGASHYSGLAQEYAEMYHTLLNKRGICVPADKPQFEHLSNDSDAGKFMSAAITALFGTSV